MTAKFDPTTTTPAPVDPEATPADHLRAYLDPCPICGDEDCTGDYSGGETCDAAPDLGGITSTGHVRPLQVDVAERGGWIIKPYPGQIVADFTTEAEAERAAAAWNYTRRLTVEEMRAAFEAGKIPKAADELADLLAFARAVRVHLDPDTDDDARGDSYELLKWARSIEEGRKQ